MSLTDSGEHDPRSTLLREVKDPRVHGVLAVILAVALIGTFILARFSSVAAAVETLALVVVFAYASLIVITASAAFSPMRQEATDRNVRAAKRVQDNARNSLFILLGLGILIIVVVASFITPVWSSLVFESSYQRLRWQLISISEFLDATEFSDPDREEILDIRDTSALIKDGRLSNARAVLRLIGQRPEVLVQRYDLRNLRHSGVIAARKVIFDSHSAIELGGKNLLVLAEDVIVRSEPDHGAAIFAFRPDDVPAPPNDGRVVGLEGKTAGSVTFVVLGKFEEGAPLSIDLRGQHGGTGPTGRQPAPLDRMPERGRQVGAPEWAFGEPEEKFLAIWIKNIDTQISDPEITPDLRNRLVATKNSIVKCKEQTGKCNTLYCRDIDFADRGIGFEGRNGERGGKGGQGGLPGDPGRLEIYRSASNVDSDDNFAGRFKWSDGKSVDKTPPVAQPGSGGEGGPGGEGAPGGLGYEADRLGVCSAGRIGASGKAGQRGDQGPDGQTKEVGSETRIGRLGRF